LFKRFDMYAMITTNHKHSNGVINFENTSAHRANYHRADDPEIILGFGQGSV
jgi:hypothetical protein